MRCSIHLAERAGVPVVCLGGDVDVAACAQLERMLLSAADGHDGRAVLDLTDVRYVESAPIGTMIKVDRILDAADGSLAIACRSDGLIKLFATAGLQEFMHVFPDLDSAVAFVSAGKALPPRTAGS